MQRRILGALETEDALDAPPLAWFEPRALGFTGGRAQAASFSRAARRLHEMGLLERAAVWSLSEQSTNEYYRAARMFDIDSVAQGFRWHLVIRSPSTSASLAEYESTRANLMAMIARRHKKGSAGQKYFEKYSQWIYALVLDGVHARDDAVPLPVGGSLDFVRDLMGGRHTKHPQVAPTRPQRTYGHAISLG